jgi:hypothetical protein
MTPSRSNRRAGLGALARTAGWLAAGAMFAIAALAPASVAAANPTSMDVACNNIVHGARWPEYVWTTVDAAGVTANWATDAAHFDAANTETVTVRVCVIDADGSDQGGIDQNTENDGTQLFAWSVLGYATDPCPDSSLSFGSSVDSPAVQTKKSNLIDCPADSAGDQPTDNAGDDPSDNAGDPTDNAGDPTDNAGDPTDNAGDDPTDNAGDPTDNAGDQPTDNAGDQPTDNAGDQPTDNAGDPSDNAGDDPSDNAGDQPTDNAGDQPTDNAGDQPTDNAGDQPTDNAGDPPTDNAGDVPTDSVDQPTGAVEAAVGTPGLTPPPTDTPLVAPTTSSTDGWRIAMVLMAAVLIGSLVFSQPGRARRKA